MFDPAALSAVAAVIRTGGFDKAAAQLHVTPSAISQRVKQLEERLGTVLIIRGQPCTATAAGRRLCRHAEEIDLLEHALAKDLGAMAMPERHATLRIAVNADSLATWFVDAMAGVDGLLFDLVIDDQDHSADWLRRGEVSAVVSGAGKPVQGCGIRPLGALRYRATASPAFIDRWFADGVTEAALARAPSLAFDAKDELQARWVAGVLGKRMTTPTHWLPSSQGFVDAVVAGLGWGMNPDVLIAQHVAEGRIQPLLPDHVLTVPLFWQWSRLVEPALRDMTASVIRAAAQYLVPPDR
jgi:LysR family transcriptional regulator (chromosome initiation inhibitor)